MSDRSIDLDIPQTVAEVLNPRARFDPAALAAIKALARSKPWQGSDAQRLAKLNAASAALSAAYGHPVFTVRRGTVDDLDLERHTIKLSKLSVVTFLNLIARARGLSIRKSFAWSINIFRRTCPLSYSRCTHDGPLLTRPDLDALDPFRRTARAA